MSDQPDTIRSCHTISSILRSRFWSLICHMSSPFSKSAQNAKGHFGQSLLHISNASTPRLQKLYHSTPLFPLEAQRKRKQRGICSGQFMTYTKIRTRVPPHQNPPKEDDKISCPNTSLQSTTRFFPRPLLLPKEQLSQGYSFGEHRRHETRSSIPIKVTVITNPIDILLHL